MLTCLATVVIAYLAGVGIELALGKLKQLLPPRRKHAPVH
jgi:hypothetical protein